MTKRPRDERRPSWVPHQGPAAWPPFGRQASWVSHQGPASWVSHQGPASWQPCEGPAMATKWRISIIVAQMRNRYHGNQMSHQHHSHKMRDLHHGNCINERLDKFPTSAPSREQIVFLSIKITKTFFHKTFLHLFMFPQLNCEPSFYLKIYTNNKFTL